MLVEIDFMDGLGKGVDENRREQVRRWRKRILGETTGIRGHLGA